MEEIEVKKSRIPNIKDIVNYKDFFGEYPLIFLIKIISSLALIYVITEFYNYHNPVDSLITKYVKKALPDFIPNSKIFVFGDLLLVSCFIFSPFSKENTNFLYCS